MGFGDLTVKEFEEYEKPELTFEEKYWDSDSEEEKTRIVKTDKYSIELVKKDAHDVPKVKLKLYRKSDEHSYKPYIELSLLHFLTRYIPLVRKEKISEDEMKKELIK